MYESKIFEHVTKQQIIHGAKQAIATGAVEFRSNLVSAVFNHAKRYTGKVNILSVNWSRYFIAACLEAAGMRLDGNAILSNELEGVEQGRPSTGRIVSAAGDEMIVSSGDKQRVLSSIKDGNEASFRGLPIVYVGDSWTDLECLLVADLGICVRDDSLSHSQKQLADALERMDIQCPRLSDWTSCNEWNVVWVEGMEEIEQWVDYRPS